MKHNRFIWILQMTILILLIWNILATHISVYQNILKSYKELFIIQCPLLDSHTALTSHHNIVKIYMLPSFIFIETNYFSLSEPEFATRRSQRQSLLDMIGIWNNRKHGLHFLALRTSWWWTWKDGRCIWDIRTHKQISMKKITIQGSPGSVKVWWIEKSLEVK